MRQPKALQETYGGDVEERDLAAELVKLRRGKE
jgi:hypothetical protein